MNTFRIPAFLLLTFALSVPAFAGWREDYGSLLRKYVVGPGVKYAEWKSDSADAAKLQSVIDRMGAEDLAKLDRNEQLAYYINAYNANIIHKVLERYPLKSVLSGNPLFFKMNKLTVGGKRMTFEDLENEVLRGQFDTALIHFGLNCGSKSCPRLLNRPYDGKTVMVQLEQNAKTYLDSPQAVQDGKVSKIFKWFRKDFEREKGSVTDYVNAHRGEKLPEEKVDFLDYDWGLNEAK